MIKFKALIHKETGTVIKYEDWKEATERDNYIPIKGAEVFINPKNIVKAKEMLYSDDFEIIYNSDFTTEELAYLWKISEATEIKDKIADIINKRIEKGRKNNE